MDDIKSRGDDGPPDDGLAAFRARLRRLEDEGCNLLVVGDAPRELFTRASASLLGAPDAPRWRVFALTDASPDSVYERLPAAADAPHSLSETTRIVNQALPPRPITDAAGTSDVTIPEVTVGDANLEGLRTGLDDAISEFSRQSGRPGQVRVAVDSLAPLLDHYEFAVVRRCLRSVCRRVHECDAVAHYLLAEPYRSDRCRRLVDEFDGVVELRTSPEDADHIGEERWHLTGTDEPTPWIPL